MARTEYYDTSTTGWRDTDDAADTTATCGCCQYSSNQQVTYVREILVEGPANWKDEDYKEYIDLVNNKTRTGWIVKYLIKGKVLITDPNVETRKMKDFIPLLKWRASEEDRAKIDQFFEEHKI